MIERLPYERLLWTSACLVLALLPHVGGIPTWVLLTCGAAIAIRLGLAFRGREAPSPLVCSTIAACAIALLFMQLHTFNGITAGTALLALVAGMKLLETRTNRDVCAVILIVFFLSLAALLAGNSFWLLAYLIGVCWLTTATLLRLTLTRPGPPWRASLRYSGRMLLQAIPLALVLWLFFPRFVEPLWRLNDTGQSANSGLSDTLSPGDITDLALSDEVAFRVHFFGPVPPAAERYWRGPVLDEFDGTTWRRHPVESAAPPPLVPQGTIYRYRISLEPYPHPWVFSLDWPTQWDLPNAALNAEYVLTQAGPVAQALDVTASSYTHVAASEPLSENRRARDIALPPGPNPRTQAFASDLRRQHPSERDYIASVLALLHSGPYFYTLTPPSLGPDPVDEFLFGTKHGFCGHYASAFAVLMRAAGIPARIVTGYYGGEFNRYADYWIVRQSDAHAWVEVWMPERGWLRIDPTGAIDPVRIDRRIRDAGANGIPSVDLAGKEPWLNGLRLRVDALRQLWRERILRYNEESQQALLARLHVPEPDVEKLVLILAAGLALGLLWLTWQVRRELRVRPRRRLERAYERLCAKLAARGLARAPYEAAEPYAARISTLRPDLAHTVQELCLRYNELRYGRDGGDVGRFAAAVRAFKPRDFRVS